MVKVKGQLVRKTEQASGWVGRWTDGRMDVQMVESMA